jgi:acetyl-CoA carboxylase biotin carboxyl carrier protein
MGSSSGSGTPDVFDVRKIRRFVELMNEHELSEIDLRQGDQRIRLRRGPETITVPAGAAPVAAGPPPAAAASASATAAATEAAEEVGVEYVTSPMVGTFYSAASPDASPFVKVGDQIGPETTVCMVEAMKVFNEIPAACTGKVTACLVENGEAVEFGQRLFKVQKAA